MIDPALQKVDNQLSRGLPDTCDGDIAYISISGLLILLDENQVMHRWELKKVDPQ